MNWYLVKLVYQIICGDGLHTAQFDEQLRIIEAADDIHALAKAQLLGHREQETFYNNKEKLVQWKFIDTTEICQLTKLSDGTELYSRIIEYEDADIYTDIIRKKASVLLKENAETVLHIS